MSCERQILNGFFATQTRPWNFTSTATFYIYYIPSPAVINASTVFIVVQTVECEFMFYNWPSRLVLFACQSVVHRQQSELIQ